MQDIILMIDGRREEYSPEEIRSTMTVGELISFLEDYDEDTKVMLSNDNGYTYGSITYGSFSEYEPESDDYDEEE